MPKFINKFFKKATTKKAIKESPEISEKATTFAIYAPVDGELVDLKEVNDGVFSEGMLGQGVAILPQNGNIVAPLDGTLTTLFHTKHAYGITNSEGVQVLVHIGIDTVNLKGQGFSSQLEQDKQIKRGQTLCNVDLNYLKANNYRADVIIIVPHDTNNKIVEFTKPQKVGHESIIFKVAKL